MTVYRRRVHGLDDARSHHLASDRTKAGIEDIVGSSGNDFGGDTATVHANSGDNVLHVSGEWGAATQVFGDGSNDRIDYAYGNHSDRAYSPRCRRHHAAERSRLPPPLRRKLTQRVIPGSAGARIIAAGVHFPKWNSR